MKTLKRIISWTIWSLLALYLIIVVLLNIPAVQRYVGHEVCQAISSRLGTKAVVERVDIGLPNRFIIDGVDIYDQKGKLMLHASRLSAKFEIYPLTRGKIAISSAQLFGLNGLFYQQDKQSKPNFQFVLDSLASKDTTSHTPLDLRINSLVVRRGTIKYDRLDIPPTNGRFNLSHLNISDISTHLMLNELTDSTVNFVVKKLSFADESGLKLSQLKLKLHANHEGATLHDFVVKLPESEVNIDSLKATYMYSQGKLAVPSIRFNGNISKSYLTPSDIKCFIPKLASFDNQIHIHSSFYGTSTTMVLRELEMFSQPEGFELSMNGSFTNFNNLHWHTNIDQLTLSAKTMDFIFRNMNMKDMKIPEVVSRFGNVFFVGEAGGVGKAISTKGVLLTDAGNANLGVGLRENLFTCTIKTDKLDLQRVLNNDEFGNIATQIDIDGNLSVLNNNKTDIIRVKGNVSSFDYKSYTYHDINVDGIYQNSSFDGSLDIDDPNGRINLKGKFKTSLKQPLANLTAEIRNLNLSAMKITDIWKDRIISANVAADFSGQSLKNAKGSFNIDNFSISSPEESYNLNNLSIIADNQDDGRMMRIRSDFADATIRGDFDYQTLLESLSSHIAHILPTMPGLPKSRIKDTKNNFVVSATFSKSDWLESLFNVPVRLHEPMYLYGRMNDTDKDLNIECSIPSITYDGNLYEDARVSIVSPHDTLHADVKVKKVMENGHRFSVDATANAYDNQMAMLLQFTNNQRHEFKGSIDAVAQFFNDDKGKATAHVNVNKSEILVNDTVWTVQPSDIVYSSNHLVVDHFSINHNKQHLIVSGMATKNSSDSLIIDLQDVDVNYITNLVNFHSVEFDGLATGRACVKSAFNKPEAYANLIVNRFTFEDGNMGVLNAQVNWNQDEKQIDIDAIADDSPHGKTIINGYVSPSKNYIDLSIQARNSRLEFLESFCGSFMKNVDVYGTGDLRLHGPLSAINLTGMAVADGKVDISSLNTTYWLRNDTIRLIPNEIIFERDSIYDSDNHIGIVNGALHHKCLTNLTYDMNIAAENLLAYNFMDYNGSTFFGKVWSTGDCSIHGKSGEIVMDINVKPEKGSFIEYNASAPDAITDQEFITWNDVTPKSILPSDSLQAKTTSIPDSDDKDEDNKNNVESDLRLNFIIDCTPDATLRVLMDQASGDYIALNGNGTIRATFYNKGSFDMFGTYLVDNGVYKLTIQNVIKKDFLFQQGGSIVFGGNPYNAVLDLKALYTVNGVPLSDLKIGNSFSNNNIRVDCIMNITGNPIDPKVDFDLDLPTVSSDAKQMVRSIINGQEEMNQQVIYLLGIGRFYTQEGNNAATGNAPQSQASLAMQSLLSGTISQQINNVLSSVIKNNNWNFGANISTGDEGWNNAEYEGLLSGRLLNNRLLINGQFGYRDNANATTSFIGDFDIRYLLFPNGNLSLKVYNQTNDRYFTKNSLNTQGIGLLMKKDFSDWRELFGRRRKNVSVKKH